MPKPLRLRELKAEMELKELSLDQVAKLSRIPYATVSQLLNGWRLDPVRLARVSKAIKSYPMPKEAAVA